MKLLSKILISIFLMSLSSNSGTAETGSFNTLFSGFELQSDPAYADFKNAKDLMYDDKYQDAMKAFKAIISKYPKSRYIDASHFWIAYSLEKEGADYEKAFAAYKLVRDSYPKSEWANDARSGMVKLAKKLYSSGKRQYKVYLKEFGEDPDEDVKLAALTALGQLNGEDALPVLIDVLKTSNSRKVKEKAV